LSAQIKFSSTSMPAICIKGKGHCRQWKNPEAIDSQKSYWKDMEVYCPGNSWFCDPVYYAVWSFTGWYVCHYHILEHEDYDMISPFKVVAPDCK